VYIVIKELTCIPKVKKWLRFITKEMEGQLMKNIMSILLLALLVGSISFLIAQNLDEDQQTMRQYKLPEQAVLQTSLVSKDSLKLLDDKPFTGTAYSRYSNGQLQNITQYVKGFKQGSELIWYPDGRPQLMSTYRKNRLNGRFKGWYQFGAVIYDLVLKDSTYTGDQLSDSDTARETGTSEDSGPSADGKDQDNDQ
jgi:antitoxin component YwqK of YwqJK toxin-antitoxin module